MLRTPPSSLILAEPSYAAVPITERRSLHLCCHRLRLRQLHFQPSTTLTCTFPSSAAPSHRRIYSSFWFHPCTFSSFWVHRHLLIFLVRRQACKKGLRVALEDKSGVGTFSFQSEECCTFLSFSFLVFFLVFLGSAPPLFFWST